MNIGQVAKASGINAKLIRHYESIGIIPKASRTASGYRTYNDNDVYILVFVKRARVLGFSMQEIKKLLGLWRSRQRKSQDVKILASKHIQEMETKIESLQMMVAALKHLTKNCHGDSRPECPILDDLASGKV